MGKKVLVVDDEADIRMFLKKLLEKNGYEVITAENGLQGFDVAKADKPDLVSLDLQMPNKTGTDFYRRIAHDKELGDLPVIVVSGIPGRNLAVKKASAVFDKPINPDDYIEAVKKAIG